MNFTSKTKVKEIALSSVQNRQVLEKAGVDYCCGGGKSLQEACVHADAPAGEILNRLRKNASQVSPEEENWQSASLTELTRHIQEKHHSYVRQAIPRLRALLEKVIAMHGENHPELSGIAQNFHEVGRELIMHMQKEEQILFPYIDALEYAARQKEPMEPPFFQTVRNPIHAMMKEHDSAGDLIKQIRKASFNYTAPADACASYLALYQDLKEFETDLHLHVHLEDNILFPRAVDLEATTV